MTAVVVHRAQVVIVGGGPAGMAAARELQIHGVAVAVVDEGARLGGQIFRQVPAGYAEGVAEKFTAPSHEDGHRLIHDVEHGATEVFSGVTVWDVEVDAGVRVFAEHNGEPVIVEGQYLLLATGAMDRTLPFPGWTLPGVVTPGAAQVMVRGQLMVPGRRAVVAGTGPLLLPTVTALLSAGVEVVALLEANGFGGLVRTMPGVVFHPHRLREALHYARCFLGSGTRMQFRRAVIAAHAGPDGLLRSVVHARLDEQGRPQPGTEQEVRADLLCVGYGLNPSTELAVRLGCEMQHNEARGGWLPRHDASMQSSVARVFVAGEIAGIGGADVAMAEGALAARAIAAEMGRGGLSMEPLRDRCRKERRAADALLSAFPVLPGLHQIAQEDTVVCRCEDVTLGAVMRASEVYGADLRSVKMATRAGMGPCQARICHRIVGGLLRERCGGEELPTPCASIQVPVKPVRTGTIAASRPVEAEV